MICRNENLIVWRRTQAALQLAARCAHCNGVGSLLTRTLERIDCAECGGRGWFGIDPKSAASADPGSVEKVAVLGVRYASGTPLWNRRDRCASEPVVVEEPATNGAEPRRKPRRKKGRKRTKANGASQSPQTKRDHRHSTSLAP